MPTGIETKNIDAKIETKSVIVEAKYAFVYHNINIYMSFSAFDSLNHYILFLLKRNFLPHLFFNIN